MFAHLIKQYATYNLRFGMLLFAITWTFFGNAQQWQEFESISFGRYSRPLVNVVKDGKQYYYHLDSQLLLDEVDNWSMGVMVVMNDGAYGVVRDDGELIVPFMYDGIKVEYDYTGQWYQGISYNYRFIVVQKNGRYGVTDLEGKVLAEPKYDAVRPVSKHVIAVAENNRWGWIDALTGELLQACVYEEVDKTYTFSDYVKVRKDGKFGVAKKDGTIVVPIESESYLYFPRLANGNYIITERPGIYTIYDSLGKMRMQGDYPSIRSAAQNNLFVYRKNGLNGLLDPRSGEVISEPQFSNILDVVHGLHIVVKDKKYGVLTEEGKALLPLEYDLVEFVNCEGQIKHTAPTISLGLGEGPRNPRTAEHEARIRYEAKIDSLPYYMKVSKGGQTGIFDWTGKSVIPLGAYSAITPYYGGHRQYFFFRTADGKAGVLDASGKELLAPRYQYSGSYQYNDGALDAYPELKRRYLLLEDDNQKQEYQAAIGLFDLKTGQMAIEPAPQSIKWLNQHYFKVMKSRSGDKPSEIVLFHADGEAVLYLDEEVRDVVAILEDRLLLVEKAKSYSSKVYLLMDVNGKVLYENDKWNTQGNYAHIRFPESKDWVAGDFHGGWKKIFSDETNLFINDKGEEKRFSDYDQVNAFFAGHALVAKKVEDAKEDDNFRFGGSYYLFGLIDSTGKEIFPPVWSSVSSHANDPYLLQVTQDGKRGLIDRRGKMLLPLEYTSIESGSSKAYLQIKKDKKVGLMTAEGEVVIEPRYDQIRTNYEGEDKTWPLLVQEGEWYYFVGKNGHPYSVRAKEYK